jgi:hypothetical protein
MTTKRPRYADLTMTRNQRRIAFEKEARLRKSGDWPAWEKKVFMPGSVGSGKGWLGEIGHAFVNQIFSVLVRNLPDGTMHFAVTSLTGIRPTWPEMQRIKDELSSPAHTAMEVYPPKAEIIDDADMYHLWVLPVTLALPFSLFDDRHLYLRKEDPGDG